jgi:hypothetical protein
MSGLLSPPAPPHPGAPAWRAQAGTTPGRLRLAFGAIIVATVLLWLAAGAGIEQTRRAIQTVGRDAVPSIVAAQRIRADLADMDANTANVFISNGAAVQTVKEQYEKDRRDADDRLITAAQNITYGDEERVPIVAITDNLETYTGLVKAARTKGWPYGIKDLRAASQLMHAELIPDTDRLDQVNFNHLNAAYDGARAAASRVQAGLLLSGLVALAVLAATQVYLTRRTRRVFNLPLLLATGTLLAFVIGMSARLDAENELLRVAKKDCFDSIHALWKARSVSYDANGDESLYLLGPATAAQYEQSFREKSALLVDGDVTDAVVSDAAAGKVPTFKGYLGDELRNITFPGEHAAAVEMLRCYGRYMAMDGQIRSLERAGRHREAVDFCIGTQPGQSNWGFAQFDDALGKVLDINQKVFDSTVVKSFAALRTLPAVAAVAVLLIVVLTWLGLAPRLHEYRG